MWHDVTVSAPIQYIIRGTIVEILPTKALAPDNICEDKRYASRQLQSRNLNMKQEAYRPNNGLPYEVHGLFCSSVVGRLICQEPAKNTKEALIDPSTAATERQAGDLSTRES